MTELTITQEYFLLTVNDRGRFSPLNPQQPICLVAAALLVTVTSVILPARPPATPPVI